MKGRLASPRIAIACAAIAFVVSLPALFNGFAADDYLHRMFLGDHGVGPYPQHWSMLFSFVDGNAARTGWLIDHGLMPWWTDPLLRVSLFRPLSSATHALDAWLFWSSPVLQHLHSILWYALVVWVAARVYRSVIGPTWIAGLAAVFFVLDPTHGIPAAWLANRNALLTGVFAIGAFGLYATGRRALAAVAFALGLACGEATVAALAFFGAHACFLDDRPIAARVKALAPLGVVFAIWAVLYRALGFGISRSGLYLEPLREPVAYLGATVVHLPLLGATELGGPPPEPYVFFGFGARAILVLLAVLFFAWATPAFVQAARRDRRARFFLVAGVLSLLPSCATFPSGRLLVIPSFAWLGLLALVVEHATTGRAARSFRMWTLIAHVGIAPFLFEVSLQQMRVFNGVLARLSAGVPSGPDVQHRRLVVLNAPDPTFTYYTLPMRRARGDIVPDEILVLVPGTRTVTVRRVDERTLTVHVEDGLYRTGTEKLTRKGPMPIGWRISVDDVQIAVTGVTPDGIPDDIEFHFDGDLADDYEWRSWDGRTLVPFHWPAPGETLTYPGHLPELF